MKCKDCFYFGKLVQKQKDNEPDIMQTICRKNSPNLEPRCWANGNFTNGNNYAYTSFPFVEYNDWCGEFKKKEG